MTTEGNRSGGNRAWRVLRMAVVALVAWFGCLATVAVVADPTPTVILVAPSHQAMAAIEATGAAVLDLRGSFALVRSDRKGFVRQLYGAGAWLVLPAPEGGCFGLTPPAR